MTTVGSANPLVLAQLQSLLALSSSLSAGSGTSSSASGTGFAQVLQALASSASASSASSGSGSSSGATGADVVADAKKYLGVPYVFGGTTSSGMDCSGLVQTVFKDLGVTGIARGVHGQMTQGEPVASLADAQPGDLIVFKGGGHIGIYAGNGMVIHAPYPGRTVSEQKLWTDDSGIETIRRIVPSGDASGTAGSSALSALGGLAGLSGLSGTDASSASTAFLLGLSLGGSGLGTSGLGSTGLDASGLSSSLAGLLGSSTSSGSGIDPTLLAQLITTQSALAAQSTTETDA